MTTKPNPPMPAFDDPDWWARMGEWLLDERPMTEQARAEAMAVCRSIPVPVQPRLIP